MVTLSLIHVQFFYLFEIFIECVMDLIHYSIKNSDGIVIYYVFFGFNYVTTVTYSLIDIGLLLILHLASISSLCPCPIRIMLIVPPFHHVILKLGIWELGSLIMLLLFGFNSRHSDSQSSMKLYLLRLSSRAFWNTWA